MVLFNYGQYFFFTPRTTLTARSQIRRVRELVLPLASSLNFTGKMSVANMATPLVSGTSSRERLLL